MDKHREIPREIRRDKRFEGSDADTTDPHDIDRWNYGAEEAAQERKREKNRELRERKRTLERALESGDTETVEIAKNKKRKNIANNWLQQWNSLMPLRFKVTQADGFLDGFVGAVKDRDDINFSDFANFILTEVEKGSFPGVNAKNLGSLSDFKSNFARVTLIIASKDKRGEGYKVPDFAKLMEMSRASKR